MSFVTLNTGLSGLRAAQTAVDVTSHNIANAATKGYTRQRVATNAAPTYQSRDGLVGTGVHVENVVRLRETFLDDRVRASVGTFASHDRRTVALERLETVYGEPEHGITGELNELWASLEDLALDPTNPASRTEALNRFEQVAGRVRDIGNASAAVSDDLVRSRQTMIDEVQSLANSVAEMNLQVRGLPSDKVSNTILDQRDVALDRLAELVGATSTLETDGTVTVKLGNESLVSNVTASSVSLSGDDLQVDGTTVPLSAYTGEFGGVQRVILQDVPAIRASLENFVIGFADAINNQNAAGFTESGASGGPLLSYSAGDAARTLTVSATSNDQLALQGSATAGRHDATNAEALADLRLTPRGDGRTHDQTLRDTVVSIGSRVAGAIRAATSAAEVATSAEVNRSSAHGVSLDEEMVSLVQYQRALEANARMMTAADEMLDTIINRLGTVGR